LQYEAIWGILIYGVEAVRSLSRRSEQVKTLLAGPSAISPMKAEITISPISNSHGFAISGVRFGSYLPSTS